ncbi:MAG: peptidoglycan-binding protein [Paracoccaceae bacterium]|nr:peptidoglycan-binding protein [Paracoccaceae bacterium]
MTTVAVVGAVAVAPTDRAEADAGDFIAGAAVGVLGTLAVQEANRSRQQTTTVRRAAPSASRIPVTERGRQTQTALNYFGYNAGAVDGQIGRGTRAAIERYQAAMGYPINGRDFPDYQFENLMAAYYWADNGGQQQTGLFGQQLLMAYKSQMAGGSMTGGQPVLAGQPGLAPAPSLVGQQPLGVQPAPLGSQQTLAGQPAPIGQQPLNQAPAPGGQPALAAAATTQQPLLGGGQQAQPVPPPAAEVAATGPAPAATALPNFMATGQAPSLASHCNTVSLQTNSNGGFTKATAVTDVDFALSEQFCLARTYAIETGQELAGQVQGVSAGEIEAQCGAFGGALSAQVAALPLKDRDAVLQDVASFVVGTGLQPADLAGTARICLGVGYRTDDMGVALGTGLILTALGERAYGELIGHHLSQGFGTTKSAERAGPWYEIGLEAASAKPLFAPGQPERIEVIRAAMNGGSAATPPVVPAAAGDQPLVTFTITE